MTERVRVVEMSPQENVIIEELLIISNRLNRIEEFLGKSFEGKFARFRSPQEGEGKDGENSKDFENLRETMLEGDATRLPKLILNKTSEQEDAMEEEETQPEEVYIIRDSPSSIECFQLTKENSERNDSNVVEVEIIEPLVKDGTDRMIPDDGVIVVDEIIPDAPGTKIKVRIIQDSKHPEMIDKPPHVENEVELPFSCSVHLTRIDTTTKASIVAASNVSSKPPKPENKKIVMCPVCDKQFTGRCAKLNLGNHLDSHSLTPKYNCPSCDKAYKQKRQLRTHVVRIHQSESSKKVPCSFCDKKFYRVVERDNHERVHTKEKPFLCDFEGCSAKFAVSVSLRQHIKVQHEGFLHLCNICGKTFRHPASYKLHLKTHETGDVICEICGATFQTLMKLNRHKKSKHSN